MNPRLPDIVLQVRGTRCRCKCFPYVFKSRWELKWAHFLEYQKQKGLICGWDYEPKPVFEFPVKRGCIDYLPDFVLYFSDKVWQYHEVKGFMDQRSRTKLKRMAKYHPKVYIRVVKRKDIQHIGKTLGLQIPGWENCP